MTNAIPNVPRELLEVIEQTWRIHYKGGPVTTDIAADAIEKGLGQLRALLSAPSPAGVDGLAVSNSGWFSLVMNAAAELETASYSITDPDAKRVAQSGADYYRSKAKSAQVVCLSDAQAIIDGLRDQLHVAHEKVGRYADQRDQQTQRIGELEGLLLRVQVSLSLDDTEWGYSGAEKYKLLADIRAALSAGKEQA